MDDDSIARAREILARATPLTWLEAAAMTYRLAPALLEAIEAADELVAAVRAAGTGDGVGWAVRLHAATDRYDTARAEVDRVLREEADRGR